MNIRFGDINVETRVSALSGCVDYAIKQGATKNSPASFFQGWRGYILDDKLVVTNFYEENLQWEFKMREVNEACLIFHKIDRCHLLSTYNSDSLKTLIPEITLGADFRIISKSDVAEKKPLYRYKGASLRDDSSPAENISVYRPDDFPAEINGRDFFIKWRGRGVLASVGIANKADERPVIEELLKAVRCWTAHLDINISIPF